mmetsp:Transcript_88433/g.249193  ORF Transcript_88433/g.249193 Transcript_88433/m.249193 type:complete len:560 (-) Transcript_88433:31-1710(-)
MVNVLQMGACISDLPNITFKGEVADLRALADQFCRAVDDPFRPHHSSHGSKLSAEEDPSSIPQELLSIKLQEAISREVELQREIQEACATVQRDLRETFSALRKCIRAVRLQRERAAKQATYRQSLEREVHSRKLELSGWGSLPAQFLLPFLVDYEVVAFSVAARLLRKFCSVGNQLVVPHLILARGSRKRIPLAVQFWESVHAPGLTSLDAYMGSREIAAVVAELTDGSGIAGNCTALKRLRLSCGSILNPSRFRQQASVTAPIESNLIVSAVGPACSYRKQSDISRVLVSLTEQLSRTTSLTELSITDALLEEWQPQLVEAIVSCKHIVRLDLTNAGLSDKSSGLLRTLMQGPRLQILRLSRNHLGSTSLMAAADGFAQGLHMRTTSLVFELRGLHAPRIDAVSVSGSALRALLLAAKLACTTTFAAHAPPSCGICTLDLRGTEISEEALNAICDALPEASALRVLSLGRLWDGTVGARRLASALPSCLPSLQLVDLTGNTLQLSDLQALSAALASAPVGLRLELPPAACATYSAFEAPSRRRFPAPRQGRRGGYPQ